MCFTVELSSVYREVLLTKLDDTLCPLVKERRTKLVLNSYGGRALYSLSTLLFLVAMRLGETPVPIPNTTVKT